MEKEHYKRTKEEQKEIFNLVLKTLASQLDAVAQHLALLQLDPVVFFEAKIKDLKEIKAKADMMMAKMEQQEKQAETMQ